MTDASRAIEAKVRPTHWHNDASKSPYDYFKEMCRYTGADLPRHLFAPGPHLTALLETLADAQDEIRRLSGEPRAQQGGNVDGVMPEHDMEGDPEPAAEYPGLQCSFIEPTSPLTTDSGYDLVAQFDNEDNARAAQARLHGELRHTPTKEGGL